MKVNISDQAETSVLSDCQSPGLRVDIDTAIYCRTPEDPENQAEVDSKRLSKQVCHVHPCQPFLVNKSGVSTFLFQQSRTRMESWLDSSLLDAASCYRTQN